jgi:hypothetical protein
MAALPDDRLVRRELRRLGLGVREIDDADDRVVTLAETKGRIEGTDSAIGGRLQLSASDIMTASSARSRLFNAHLLRR